MTTQTAPTTTDEFGRVIPNEERNEDEIALRDRLLQRRRKEAPPREDKPSSYDRPPARPRTEYNDYHKERTENREEDLHPDMVVRGKVTRLESYGAFVQLSRHQNGLLHISQLTAGRVDQVTDVVNLDQEVYVRILDIDGRRIRMSMISVNQKTGVYDPSAPPEDPPPRSQQGRGFKGGPPQMERRAGHRWEMMHHKTTAWDEPFESEPPGFLRILWSASPEPPPLKEKDQKVKKPEASDSSSASSDSESSSDDSRERRKRRRRGRSSKDRRRRSKRRRRRSYSSSSSESSSSASSSDESSRAAKKRRRSEEQDTKLEEVTTSIKDDREAQAFKEAVQGIPQEDSDDDEEGPQPLPQSNAALDAANVSYGKALLPGEGQALAQYVQQNLRIPRRGEIGYEAEDIDRYEKSGYVMSGSRHARMNAVRLRKENQVYSAEEQRALALITMEEKQQKETALVEDFRKMLREKQSRRDAGEKH